MKVLEFDRLDAFLELEIDGKEIKEVSEIPLIDAIPLDKVEKAIEEITKYARFHRDKTHNDTERGKYLAYEKCIEIIKRNIGE